MSRKFETEVDLAAHLTYEDKLNSQEGVLYMLSFPSPSWLSDLKTSYAMNQQVHGILQALSSGQAAPKGYSL